MSTIGTITIPESNTDLVFPLSPQFPLVTVQEPEVVSHLFNSGDRKITQRFLVGANTRRFTLNFGALPRNRYQTVVEFFQNIKGPYSTFLLTNPNGAGTIRVRLADENLSLQMAMDAVASGASLTLLEVPTSTPTYSVSNTLNRFPSAGLNTALLSQTQEIIPLVKIIPQNSACPPIYLSDRKVQVGSSVYEPRVLDFDGIGQSSGGESDTAKFSLGNADRVFSDLTKTVNLFKARLEFSLFHVGSTTLLNLWAGDVTSWSFSDTNTFQIEAADGIWETRCSYPARKITRTDWKTPQGEAAGNCSGCPFAGTCNRDWDSCGAKNSFGGIIANPETVYLGGWAKAQKDNSFTSKSIVDDNLYGKVVPEVYMDYQMSKKIVNGVETWEQAEMPVDCLVAAVRDEREFLVGLGIVGEGEIVEFGTGHTLNGAVHHGPGNLGLRLGYGYDPVPAQSPDGFGQFFNLSDTSGTYTSGRAAGTAFIEVRTVDSVEKQLQQITNYVMKAYIRLGKKGWMWNAPGDRFSGVLSNPIWVAVNMVLKAKGVQNAPAAVQEQYFDCAKAVADAAFCNATINKVVAGGQSSTRKRYQFRGIVKEEKALKDWLVQVLNTCLGGFTFSFGKFRTFLRANSGAVSAFTEGNVIADSLQVAPIAPAFNQITAQFGNGELEFVNDAVGVAAHEHARMVGSTIAPSYTKSDINLAGVSSRDEAAVWVATRLKEELGGATAEEWIAARKLSFRTTILALETEPGMVCSLTHPNVPVNETANNTHEFRITQWRLNRDYSIDIQGQSVTDSCYDMLQGPNPVDVEVPGLPVIDTSTLIPPDVSDVSTLPIYGDNLRATIPVRFRVPNPSGTLTAIKAYALVPHDSTTVKDAGRHAITYDEIDANGYFTIYVDVNKPADADTTALIYLVSCSNVYEKVLDLTNTPHTTTITIPQVIFDGQLPGTAPNVAAGTTAQVWYKQTPEQGWVFGFEGNVVPPTSNFSGCEVYLHWITGYNGSTPVYDNRYLGIDHTSASGGIWHANEPGFPLQEGFDQDCDVVFTSRNAIGVENDDKAGAYVVRVHVRWADRGTYTPPPDVPGYTGQTVYEYIEASGWHFRFEGTITEPTSKTDYSGTRVYYQWEGDTRFLEADFCPIGKLSWGTPKPGWTLNPEWNQGITFYFNPLNKRGEPKYTDISQAPHVTSTVVSQKSGGTSTGVTGHEWADLVTLDASKLTTEVALNRDKGWQFRVTCPNGGGAITLPSDTKFRGWQSRMEFPDGKRSAIVNIELQGSTRINCGWYDWPSEFGDSFTLKLWIISEDSSGNLNNIVSGVTPCFNIALTRPSTTGSTEFTANITNLLPTVQTVVNESGSQSFYVALPFQNPVDARFGGVKFTYQWANASWVATSTESPLGEYTAASGLNRAVANSLSVDGLKLPMPSTSTNMLVNAYGLDINGNRNTSPLVVHVTVTPGAGTLNPGRIDTSKLGGGMQVTDGKLAWKPGDGLSINANGQATINYGPGLAFSLGQLVANVQANGGVGLNGNQLYVPMGAIDSTRLATGALGDLSKYASDKRPIVITYGTPYLPDSNYPNGSIVFNTYDGKLYRNVYGTWTKGSDPADLIAGTLAAGVVYAGRIAASQIDAGTVNVGSGGINISGSGGLGIFGGGNIAVLVGKVMAEGGGDFTSAGSGWLIRPGTVPSLIATGFYANVAYVDCATYKIGGTTVINSSRQLVNVTLPSHSDHPSLSIGGTTVIDSSMNIGNRTSSHIIPRDTGSTPSAGSMSAGEIVAWYDSASGKAKLAFRPGSGGTAFIFTSD